MIAETTEPTKSVLPKGFGLWRECPEDVSVAWGARAISVAEGSFDIVFDRQSWHGPEELRKAFSKVLNAGPIEWAREECYRLKNGFMPHTLEPVEFEAFANRLYRKMRKTDPDFPRPPVGRWGLHPNNRDPKIVPYVQPVPRQMRDEAEAFTLYTDWLLTIRADTNASYGYIYLVAFPTHQAIDVDAVKPRSEYGDDSPKPGDIFWSGNLDVPAIGDTVMGPEWICDEAIVLGYKVEHGFLGIVTCPLEPTKDWTDQHDKQMDSRLCFMFGNDLREM